jgi:outer membrane protein assembly factor BamD
MKAFYALIIPVLLLLASCSTYNEVVKGDDYEAKYQLANELYDNGKFVRSVTLYEQVYQRAPKTIEGEISYYRLGKAFYFEEDWYMASYYLSSFAAKFPFSEKVEETMFLSALCSVHNSPAYSLDQTETELALNELQLFVSRYPNSPRIDTCNIVMDQLRFKLEKKEAETIRLYAKTENFRAAVVTASVFLEDHPFSQYREEMSAILVRNSYRLAVNSIESKREERVTATRDYLNNFLAEFPQSSYLREFKNYPSELDDVEIPVQN